MKNAWRSLAAVGVLVIGVYAYMAQSPGWEPMSQKADHTYYNLLVQGFRAGQLSLKKEVPPGLTQLADPYDPTANVLYRDPPYRMHDLSYYKGRLYLYFGVTPALILFWPYATLTGQYLLHKQAVAIFCALGFLASMGLLCAVWKRYFAELSVGVVAACALALGLATGVPVLLSWAGVYEVPISCGYTLTMLALGGIWCAVHEPERRCRWLAAASMAYGLAVGARPNLLFGAVILLIPVAQAWDERRLRKLSGLLAAMGPIALIVLGLMLYNARRFDNPFEFGMHYQLGGKPLVTQQLFSLHYFWFNFRVYFLEPAHWSTRFPFVHDIVVPPLPPGHWEVGRPFGILTNIPLVWLALAVPLSWRSQSGQAGSVLRWFITAVTLLVGICALTLGLFCSAMFRYEVDFLPALLLLAVVGILGLEHSLADRPQVWRRAVRWGWGLLLAFSVAFNLLASVEYYTDAQNSWGHALFALGKTSEAVGHYQQALRINPDFAEAHFNLGVAFVRLGRLQEATQQFEQALRTKPNYAEAHSNLGFALEQAGKTQEAMGHWEQALRIKPDYAEAHNNLGFALWEAGRGQEALGHYEQAVRIKPDFAEAHYNLGVTLEQAGRGQEALGHYEQALRIKPDYADAHNNLGNVFLQEGRVSDAIGHYEQALRSKPDYAEAHFNLGVAFARLGRLQEAMGHWEQALRSKPDYAEAHYALGMTLEQAGRVREAIGHYEQALRIKPDYAQARDALVRLQARQ